MPINCPHCGQISQDLEFCDHCNKELRKCFEPSSHLTQAKIRLQTGEDVSITLSSFGNLNETGSILCDSESHRVFILDDATMKIRGSQEECRTKLADVLPLSETHKVNEQNVLVVHCSSGNSNWDIKSCEYDDIDYLWKYIEQVTDLLEPVIKGLEKLHENGFVWLNFNPSQLKKSDRGIVFNNLDVLLYAMKECPEKLPISAMFSPPEVYRFDARKIDATTDVFHIAAWLYYLIAGIPKGFRNAKLNSFEWRFPTLRTYRNALPPGIWHTLRDALEPNSEKRTQSITMFWNSWRLDIARIRERMLFSEKICCKQFAGKTETGKAKESLNLPNQDAFYLNSDSEALLAAVVDGVTKSDFGSGDLASGIAIDYIKKEENKLFETEDRIAFESLVRSLFEKSSESISKTAISLRPKDVSDGDLMTTTALLAKIDSRFINLAYVGDSRAYLISDGYIEQLTIDGDLMNSCLIAGDSPDTAYGLGLPGKALSTFLGNSHIELKSNGIETYSPKLARFPLIPEDYIVLCTDGLIEEGVFLEPEEVRILLENNKARSIEECVAVLVNEAAIRQRPRSEIEPSGFGDNITCVLVRIEKFIEQPKPRKKRKWKIFSWNTN